MSAHADNLWVIVDDRGSLDSGSKPRRVMHVAKASDAAERTDQCVKISEIVKYPVPKRIGKVASQKAIRGYGVTLVGT